MSPFMGDTPKMRLKRIVFYLASGLALAGCQTARVLDERVSARIGRSGWLRPPPVWVVRPAKAGRTVALRAGPGRSHAPVRALAPGETVTPLGSVGPWRAVRAGQESGYVSTRDLRLEPSGPGLFARP